MRAVKMKTLCFVCNANLNIITNNYNESIPVPNRKAIVLFSFDFLCSGYKNFSDISPTIKPTL